MKSVCLEWLRWGLGNCERVGKAHCFEMLNCHGNTMVQERSSPDWLCIACLFCPFLLWAGFPCLLESPGFFLLKFSGPGKSWKMSFVLEST